ncbi:hypothetical protein HAX54_023638 [Datura stramonium]|uniref:Uncharacterized protein n=1 Tax=Datura stramonium TaxID=4076 RepID=A0ABS8UYM4_DATST|nr:hypothetical protein [Datura stramonium]
MKAHWCAKRSAMPMYARDAYPMCMCVCIVPPEHPCHIQKRSMLRGKLENGSIVFHQILSIYGLGECILEEVVFSRKMAEQRDNIFHFRKIPGEELFESLERFKQYVIIAPTHGFLENIILEKFYTGFYPLTQLVANNPTSGYFMDRTYKRNTTILDRITKNN